VVYDGSLNEGLIAHTDSDWGGNPIKQWSTTGFFASLSSGIVCWKSHLQNIVALSSTKAEYMAMSDTCRQIVWIQSLFQELGYDLVPTPICGDNQGSIFIGSNLVQEQRTKHIDIQYHYICECIEDGTGSILGLSSLMTNPAPKRAAGLEGGVGTYSPLPTHRTCDSSHDHLLRLPGVVPTLNSGPCTFQLCI